MQSNAGRMLDHNILKIALKVACNMYHPKELQHVTHAI
uniref:Uncharacterized protein n=1 Tax=Arundo donax TaxID=35708 RepID=A0A0A8ZE08_ARUDO